MKKTASTRIAEMDGIRIIFFMGASPGALMLGRTVQDPTFEI
jgi:hypothetical protein